MYFNPELVAEYTEIEITFFSFKEFRVCHGRETAKQ